MSKLFSLKFKKGTSNTGYISAYIPEELKSFISLYSIYAGESRSTLLREILNAWMHGVKSELNPSDITEELANRVAEKFNKNYRKEKEFLDEIESSLQDKGIEQTTIGDIIGKTKEKIKYGTTEDEK